MLFSVIIPVYNSEKFIRRCINSILEQTYQKFEVIVIDDGSTDSTSKILKNFSEEDARIKVYKFDNSGVTKARQRGVLLAKGDYILFVDADDTINKELLFNIWKTIEDFPNVEIVRFRARMVDDKPGYDHELYNHSMRYVREKSRATNFLNAYKYLMENMHQIEREYDEDFHFFYEDWKNRLLKKYNLLGESLKDELRDDFEQELKRQ